MNHCYSAWIISKKLSRKAGKHTVYCYLFIKKQAIKQGAERLRGTGGRP